MQRLAALVPRPRLHLIRYHGVLAPNAMLRPLVVPHKPEVQGRDGPGPSADCSAEVLPGYAARRVRAALPNEGQA